MTSRFLVTYALLMIAVLTFSYFQNRYYPAVLGDANRNSSSVQQADPDEETDESREDDTKGEGSEVSPDSSDELVDDQADSEENSEVTDTDLSVEENAKPPSELHTIGSLAETSSSRYLITVDAAGATVRRVELNFRESHRPGKFKYRDLEFSGGYIGELDCVDTDDGCKIRCVGKGTPAFSAGLQVGDIVVSIDGESVVTAEDLSQMLERLEPNQTLKLQYRRGDSDVNLETEIVTTDKPIELLRPQPDILENDWKILPSFRTTLLKPSQQDVWAVLAPAMMDGNWNLESKSSNSVALSYTVSDKQIQESNVDLKGPIKVTKTYSLVDESGDNDSVQDFHFLLDIQIENLSDAEQEICYQLNGPLGTPTETWWYQNKIHGRTWAIGYVAGARDVVASTAQDNFKFFGGPEIASNLRSSEPDYFWVLPKSQGVEADQTVEFVSVDTQYFNVSLLPEAGDQKPFTAYSILADAAVSDIPSSVKEQKLVDCTFKLFKTVMLKPANEQQAVQPYKQRFKVFAGPKEAEVLEKYDLDSVRTFGWFTFFSKPLCWLLHLFYTVTFKFGYGIPIILLTVLVRSLMIPVSRKAALNAQMMQYLQPQMKELNEKYKDDLEKRGLAQRELFRKYNYNPLSGCLVGLIQIPIFIGLYRGLSVDIALRDQPLLPGLNWCSDLSAPDKFWYWKDTLPEFLGFLTHETGWLGPYLNILPIITCVLFVIQQKMFTPPAADEQQEMIQKVMKYMMIVMGVLFFKVPAGLCLYFITSSMWGIAERKMLPKPKLDTSKLDNNYGAGDGGKFGKQEIPSSRQLADDERRRAVVDEKKRLDKERKKRRKRS